MVELGNQNACRSYGHISSHTFISSTSHGDRELNS